MADYRFVVLSRDRPVKQRERFCDFIFFSLSFFPFLRSIEKIDFDNITECISYSVRVSKQLFEHGQTISTM